ncbi:SMP-30/gluconolaconase/LRE-like protein [Nocardia tenerifensis]|uniref:SMP-30/gluconolaconase/LRE-like protein n=1 Tax=Nocardia tenerifensis TaxID=228006 RepID=A0A318K736_9NOCA|nr:SMP-30/gluconolactonase/LRE family protein [Nocardia tenerifensis]PXX69158.1 SMP-30/gluconolaconase/LRE-like protein [Nocardia tenerifensis]
MAIAMGSNRIRAAVLAIAISAAAAAVAPMAAADPYPPMCAAGWEATTLVEGVGNLENLDADGAGGFYVTGLLDGFLAHVDSAGRFEKVLTGLDHPAGVRVAGPYVYFVTGDGLTEAPGTLQRYEIATGAVTVLVTGLNGANGLLLLPDGDLLFSTIGMNGPPTGIGRYRPSTGEYTRTWSSLPLTNGLALAPDGKSIYTDNLTMRVFRVPLDAPESPVVVAGIPNLVSMPDDMEATRSDTLFVADHAFGSINKIDTSAGQVCAIITGLIKPGPMRNPPDGTTSVRIARDGDGWALYITSMDGTLRRLRPPADIDLTPASPTR